MTKTIDRLFRRYRRTGDATALGSVFDLAAPELMRLARHLCADEAEAEDALQATFQTALEKSERWDGERGFLAWTTGILALHAKKARERAERRFDPERAGEREVPDPARLAADRELLELVRARVDGLPETYVAAVRGHLLEGRSAGEIARELGISANAASVRLHRGLKLLERALPAGASLAALVAVARPARGLPAVRRSVLVGAGAEAGAAAALTAGAALGAKPLVALVGVALAGAAALYVAPLGAAGDEPTAANDVARAEVPSAEPAVDAPAPAAPDAPEVVATRDDTTAGTARAAAADPQLSAEEWLERFRAAEGWREGLAVGNELAELDPERSLEILRAIYHRIPAVEHRQQLLKPFVFHGGQPNAVEVLHLAATDEDPAVRGWAFGYLRAYAFRDFEGDVDAYLAWRERFEGMPLADVLATNARELVQRVGSLSGPELERELRLLDRLDLRPGRVAGVDLAETLRGVGLLGLIDEWLLTGSDDARETALSWLTEVEPPRAFVERAVVPMLDAAVPMQLRTRACSVLGRRDAEWAVDPLVGSLAAARPQERAAYFAACDALSDIGSPRAVPLLIAVLAADDRPEMRYGIGYFGLKDLTGVPWDESHDAAFWLDWWERNRHRLPPEIGSAPLPEIALAR